MINRRLFMQTLAAAATGPVARADTTSRAGFGPLRPDPRQILDLPVGFEYNVVARRGDIMDDGLIVPDLADGMAAFPGSDGRVILVCNHENSPGRQDRGPFGAALERLDSVARETLYDAGGDITPGTGGTTTIVWDPRERRRVRQHMSLLGTEVNCAGGPTPWGSWLSCEESFAGPGRSSEDGHPVIREQRHGYVFEVPAAAAAAVRPRPLAAMGRFEHEAATVDPATGIVYLTEDRHRSLLYRFIPAVPGTLARGGRLQALVVAGAPQFDTRNWGVTRNLEPGDGRDVTWIDLDDVDPDEDDLRLRGHAAGAALFARGEGICRAGGDFVMTCTIGGVERLGQVFAYRPGVREGQPDEQPGRLTLLAESGRDSLLRHADNLTGSPWGDIIICEDTADHCGLVGLRPDGRQYALADNAYTSSELAGVCFSPDGRTLFVNVQERGLTLAIRGPWPAATDAA